MGGTSEGYRKRAGVERKVRPAAATQYMYKAHRRASAIYTTTARQTSLAGLEASSVEVGRQAARGAGAGRATVEAAGVLTASADGGKGRRVGNALRLRKRTLRRRRPVTAAHQRSRRPRCRRKRLACPSYHPRHPA